MDCVFYEAFEEEQKLLDGSLTKDIRAEFTSKTIQEDSKKIPPASLISIRTQSVIPNDWAKNIKGILTRSVGYDHLIEYRNRVKVDIPCGYLPTYCARAVAEQAVMMTIMLLRKLKRQVKNFETFNRDGITGGEIEGRNLLVIGVGNIGSQVVDIGKGLRMNIKGVDIEPKIKEVEYILLKDGLTWADIIICALPLTSLTRGMLNYGTLKNVKTGPIFINIARGEISPLGGLRKLLDENILGGLGLDVYEDEARVADYLHNKNIEADENIKIVLELKERDDCIFTPHNAFNTSEATTRKAKESVESIVAFIKKGKFPHPIPKE